MTSKLTYRCKRCDHDFTPYPIRKHTNRNIPRHGRRRFSFICQPCRTDKDTQS